MIIGAFAVVTSPETGNFLLGLRKDGKFGFFGGRCEKDELPPITVIREFYEETNVVIQNINLLGKLEPKKRYKRIVWFYEVDLYETVVLKLNDEHRIPLVKLVGPQKNPVKAIKQAIIHNYFKTEGMVQLK